MGGGVLDAVGADHGVGQSGDADRRRVALLAGVPASALQDVLDQRLRLKPGAETLLRTCREAGLKTLLVSGGFTFFADPDGNSIGLWA